MAMTTLEAVEAILSHYDPYALPDTDKQDRGAEARDMAPAIRAAVELAEALERLAWGRCLVREANGAWSVDFARWNDNAAYPTPLAALKAAMP